MTSGNAPSRPDDILACNPMCGSVICIYIGVCGQLRGKPARLSQKANNEEEKAPIKWLLL